MYVIGRPVLGRSHRLLTTAVEQATRLLARLVDAAGDDRRAEPAHVAGAAAPQPAAVPAVAGGGSDTAPTPKRQQPRQHRDAARHTTTAAVTPALVRRWAQQQGIQVAERGRIPRSVMEQYLTGTVPTAPSRRTGRGASTARRPRSGRRTSAA